MKLEPFFIERTFAVSPARLWQALTDPEQMRQWYFDLPGFKAEVGYEFIFEGGRDDRKYRHLCKVTEVVPEERLSYSWRYEGYEGDSLVTFELVPKEKGTLLRLTHAGLHTFPQNNPDMARESFAEGWLHIIGSSLKIYMEQAAADI